MRESKRSPVAGAGWKAPGFSAAGGGAGRSSWAYSGQSRSPIPGESDCPFRAKPITDSGQSRSPITDKADHRFRAKPITHSGRSRSPIPEQADHRFRAKPIAHSGEADRRFRAKPITLAVWRSSAGVYWRRSALELALEMFCTPAQALQPVLERFPVPVHRQGGMERAGSLRLVVLVRSYTGAPTTSE